MADNMLAIPEGGVEIPTSPAPSGAGLLPVPEGGEAVRPQLPSASEVFLEGARQGFAERKTGFSLLGKSIQSVGDFVMGLPNGPLKEQMQQQYQQALQEKADYEAAGQIYPPASKGLRTAGDVAANIAVDLPLTIVGTRGKTAVGRATSSMATGFAEGMTLPAASEEERVRNGSLAAAFGGIGTMGFEAARINANIVNKQLNRALAIPDIAQYYEKSKVLEGMTGIDFTLGQSTGSRTLQAYENMAANASASADKVLSYRNKQLVQSINYLKGAMSRLGNSDAPPEVVGNQLKEGMLKTVGDLDNVRRQTWDNFMSKASIAIGDKPIGVPTNTAAALDDIIEEISHPNSGYSQQLIDKFKALRTNANTPWTVNDFQTTMKTWGRNAAGTSQPFEELHIADQKRIFRVAVKAMQSDLDAIAKEPGLAGTAAENLTLARTAYKNYSDQIDNLEITLLGDAIDKGGRPASAEDLYTKFRKMPTSEMKQIIPLMNAVDPTIMNNVRARIFKDAFQEASDSVASPTALIEFNPAVFFKKISSTPNADLIFQGAPMKEYLTAIAAIKRVSQMAGEGAATSPAQTSAKAGALIGGAAQAQGLPNMIFLSKFLVENLTPNRYAKLLMTPEGRNAVINLSKGQKAGRKVLNASLGTIVGILTSKDSLNEEESPIQGQVQVEQSGAR